MCQALQKTKCQLKWLTDYVHNKTCCETENVIVLFESHNVREKRCKHIASMSKCHRVWCGYLGHWVVYVCGMRKTIDDEFRKIFSIFKFPLIPSGIRHNSNNNSSLIWRNENNKEGIYEAPGGPNNFITKRKYKHIGSILDSFPLFRKSSLTRKNIKNSLNIGKTGNRKIKNRKSRVTLSIWVETSRFPASQQASIQTEGHFQKRPTIRSHLLAQHSTKIDYWWLWK